MIVAFIGFIFGTVLGSFVDCIANRSVTKTSFFGRSFCESCKKKLEFYELIPILSYVLLQGKCRKCQKKIGTESLLIEILMGLLSALMFYVIIPANFLEQSLLNQVTFGGELYLNLFILIILTAIFITDIKTGLIPDRITYPSVLIFLVSMVVITVTKITLFYYSLKGDPLGQYLLPPHSDYFNRHVLMNLTPIGISVLAAVGIGLFFLILILLTRGRGMGGGDMKLGVFLGLSFGFPDALTLLVLSFFIGSVFGVALLVIGKKKFGQTIPFGPFLSLAGLITLFWGEKVLQWYLNLRLN